MGFFAAESAILDRLDEELADLDCRIFPMTTLESLGRSLISPPAVYLIYDGEQVGGARGQLSSDGYDQIDAQFWLAVVAVADFSDPVQSARAAAEPIIDAVCLALCGFEPLTDGMPLIRVTGPNPVSLEGKALFPLRFRLQIENDYYAG